MDNAALVRTVSYILGYVLLLLLAFVAVYLLLHRASREERSAMKRQSRGPRVGLLLAVLLAPASLTASQALGDNVYLFSYFTGNGEDGLHLATSDDGLAWRALNDGQPLLAPQVGSKLMRDPSVVRAADGSFHLVWTTGWWDRGIGVARSRDLVSWSSQRFVPVMEHEPTAMNCWAPELYFDEPSGRFFIIWATTIPGRFPLTAESGNDGPKGRTNHRLYYVTTRDFDSFSETKLLYDGGFNAIDAVLVPDGDEVVMIVKDEAQHPVPTKHLRVVVGETAEGPWGPPSAPISPSWVEGPSPLRVGDWWFVYYDEYTRHHYGAIRSRDLRKWEVVSEQIRFPEGTRHGTAFVAPRELVARIEGR